MEYDEFIDPTDQSSQGASSERYLLGFVCAHIVGVKYYSGTISGREMVGLVREPLNPYDENAIRVLNTRATQVGHIERSVAAVLSPLIDSELIIVEGIVPKTYSASTLSESMAVKERKAKNDFKSVDEIFKLVDENFSKKGILEALEPPRSVIKSNLFLHQKEGLGWLVHRENSGELPPFWEEKDGAFVNVLTNYHTNTRPEPLRGGILADDMGLGKTLTLLSLIALDKDSISLNTEEGKHDENGGRNEGFAVSSGKKGKRRGTNKQITGSEKKRKTESTSSRGHVKGKSVAADVTPSTGMNMKTTLVVCPASVISTWISQLEEHTKPGTLKTYMYYGDKRTEDAEELKMYDLVLTTYTTLATEESSPDSPINKVYWWRVILDEAHVIKNVNAKQSQAVMKIVAERRWAVTGTPIQNGLYDLFSLMAFLRFQPFSTKSYWQSLVQLPLVERNPNGLLRLQVLMATISLRRTKDKALVGLPPKTVETCFVELLEEERKLYDQIESRAKNIVAGYFNDGSITRNYSTVLGIILRLRQICTDMALCPSDIKSLLPSNSIEDVSNNPELLQKLVEVLQDGEDFDCPICISPPTDIVITCCAHIFCQACILKTLQRSKACCPLCRHPLNESDLFSAPPQSSDADAAGLSSDKTSLSSKVSALVKLLVASRDQHPSAKSVVFSQFRKMLILLEQPLKAAGFKTLRLDGTMNAKRRVRVMEEFAAGGTDEPIVLLASLKATGTGINLTAASRVYLLEPWWNPGVEEQAMDRVHRIGQKEEVKIVRLIAKNSIEERILELQEKKQQLAKEAFGKRKAKDGREVGGDDFRMLLSL
ncbi:putative SWI/SNF-related matrix-associated actin-dependent regulator of chromatin subfamily A member 3-like 1 isoform X2 [Neltuma alba]|uniref:putative SWI/SNF-related matrix-associated actin-dependent regulator of chromatin subfamily A member 3-like 1 isoform X2 n=1 Tax=Neltuma alba TaxID=207710 RepID=UPI0010A4A360|nr:putative SWI/SNF-related matrix-associated actin-dependent regulator of chromatin subfamily A member 3-like 1 isoform X2 [Prosopis alba]XP_028779044.1 putative SWI/SNF-related matrix-associated actin-dependent regulator of chromatin subfamily A member 3-like 1 isoform X2 [Prosopis alba]